MRPEGSHSVRSTPLCLEGEVVWRDGAFLAGGATIYESRRVRILAHDGGAPVVLKRFLGATATASRDDASFRFHAERAAAWALRASGPYTVKPLATVIDAPCCGMVYAFYRKYGSLDRVLHGAFSPARKWRRNLARDVACGVCAAHALGIMLRDVKPANVLVGNDAVARVSDFELSAHYTQLAAPRQREAAGPASKPLRNFEATPEYAAPELIRAYEKPARAADRADPMRHASSFASDVYALAVSINECATREVPFLGVVRSEVQLQTIIEASYTTPSALCRDVAHKGVRPRLGDFAPECVEKAWADSPQDRPTAAACVQALGPDGPRVDLWDADAPRTWRKTRLFDDDGEADDRVEPLDAAEVAALLECERRILSPQGPGAGRTRAAAHEGHCGRRERMEDCAAVVDFGSASSLYVVADGHGGAGCAKFACSHLPVLLARALGAAGGDVAAALAEAFVQCDAAFHRHVEARPCTAGACVAVALVIGDALWTAHVGDCRILLDRDGDATWRCARSPPSPDALAGPFAGGVVRLTADHVAADAAEAQRVRRCGGRVGASGDGTPRVAAGGGGFEGLQVTRALGDSRRCDRPRGSERSLASSSSGGTAILQVPRRDAAADGLWADCSLETRRGARFSNGRRLRRFE
ncbi:phosphatase 2C-like domain-containing protein [Pelagophyceae sp. CCMP2097]|nr:phosphatase 2C-like domain-containing protein [Pelagophyceae sp. CCMP2097]